MKMRVFCLVNVLELPIAIGLVGERKGVGDVLLGAFRALSISKETTELGDFEDADLEGEGGGIGKSRELEGGEFSVGEEDFFLCGDFRESLSRVLGGEVGVELELEVAIFREEFVDKF